MNKDNKKFVAESVFIKEAIKDNLSLNEFLLLLYFDNSYDSVFEIEIISKVLNMSVDSAIDAYSKLLKKKLISVKAEKNSYGKIVEKVSLDNYYRNIKVDVKQMNKESQKRDIYSIFEEKFGRTLSSMDYEIINAWIDKGFSEELILKALDEAVYNGANNLRYIDKILYEWNRKGYKSIDDLNNGISIREQPIMLEASLLNYNWLDEK